MEGLDDKVRAVLAMLKSANRLTVTPEDLVKFLSVKSMRSSMGAALQRGALLEKYPLEMTMLFAAARPGPLPPKEELWRQGRAAARAHRRRQRALERQIAEDKEEERRAREAAARLLAELPGPRDGRPPVRHDSGRDR
jgi:hypothetical protein